MIKLSDNKLSKLKSLDSQGGFWYITKQNLIFRDLCFMAKILETWNDRKEENYQSFFDRYKTLPDYGALTSDLAHRATKNCEYIGLTVPSDKYSAQNLTPFYFALSKMCDGDFNKLSSYPHIVDKQLERMYIDSQTNSVYSVNFKICPFMFLFKVLLLLGDITKSFKITKAEFKLFVATAQTWSEYFEVVESILRYRNDAAYRAECDKNNNKVSDSRYQVLAQNHSQLEVDGNNISIKDSEIRNVRRKVAEYELSDKIQSAEDIFEPMTGVSSNEKGDVDSLYTPYLTALRTKPFMLLAGISGTGKSRLVKELAFMTCLKDVEDPDGGIIINAQEDATTPFNYCLVEVKPNWHDSSELLGYYNALESKYELTPFIRFVYRAIRFPEMPFFVCLDEMNLAPVEQYFAEYLSALETRTLTKEGIVSAPLLDSSLFNGVNTEKYDAADTLVIGYLKENGLKLPNNLYVVGTVNMDDTTHQFSRKVIDRAFTIEMNGGDLNEMFSQKNADALKYRTDVVPLETLQSNFIHASEIFEAGSPYLKYEQTIKESVPSYLNAINTFLKDTPFQVSYRVQNELILYLAYLIQQNNFPDDIEALTKEAVLAVLMEKILPRVQGDDKLLGRGKDKDVFTELSDYVEKNLLLKEQGEDNTEVVSGSELYRQVTDKLDQMHKRLENSYFANFF